MVGLSNGYRIGVDIGGTFTDIVCLAPDGRVHTLKVSSTVDDFALGIIRGMKQLLQEMMVGSDVIAEIVHGTTVASNAILEAKGAKIGLLTTKGFRDTLEIRRLRMPRLYDLAWQKPAPLVERYLRLELDERINSRGAIVRPLVATDVEQALETLLNEGIQALSVCLINSYTNPAHEQMVKSIVQNRAPQLPICISSEILPEAKEYERTSTTVINTYVMPIVKQYLSTLKLGLSEIGLTPPLQIMQSNGGTMSADSAAELPMYIIESGPAAGVVGSQALARMMESPNVITFDMGGTTAKASIIENGEVNRATEYEVGGGIMLGSRLLRGAGYLLRVPAIDLAEVGAGGGSIVQIDVAGAIRVGPRSAGAFPGPVCYDIGGSEPTITDANVILGYLNPNYLVDGAVRLNAAKARAIFETEVAQPLHIDLAEAAYGAHLVAVSNMIRAIKAVSSERGRDPRQYVLYAFGGNGPLFAAAMAAALGMRRIVIPPAPGLFSSFGLLYADVQHHYVRTYRRKTREIDLTDLDVTWRRMEDTAVERLASEGFTRQMSRIQKLVDIRYYGQASELTLPVSGSPGDSDFAAGGADPDAIAGVNVNRVDVVVGEALGIARIVVVDRDLPGRGVHPVQTAAKGSGPQP